MKKCLLFFVSLALCSVFAQAAEVPQELKEALPQGAEELMKDMDFSGVESIFDSFADMLEDIQRQGKEILRQRLRSIGGILFVVVLCGALSGLYQGVGFDRIPFFLPSAGALSITALTAGSLDSLVGLGVSTIGELNVFSKVLLPTLAAASAAAGGATTATLRQVTTVFFVDLLLRMIDELLLPIVYLYIGTLTASCCLPDNRLGSVAEALKKIIIWFLTTALLLFTLYLSITGIFTHSVDSTTVKITKAAISGMVPVVGGIIAEASETVLAGAGLVRGTIGIFGVLAILAACAYPFLHLGIQYLLYKLTSFLSGAIGSPQLRKLIDGLGSAFGLVLGMTGSCALLLLISILASMAVVIS